MKKVIKKIIGYAFPTILIVGLITLVIQECVTEYKEQKQYGDENYEIVVVDKYNDLDSKFLVFGTKSAYHIVYKWRLTNRPSNPTNMQWYTEDVEVQYTTYHRVNAGYKFNSSIQYYHFY